MGASKSWMDNLSAIVRHRSVTYKDLSTIKVNWEFVLPELCQSQVSIDQSKVDNRYKAAFQMYNSLLKWKKENGKEATLLRP